MANPPTNTIIHGDCIKELPRIIAKHGRPTMIFADPPDNLGLKYNGFKDKWPTEFAYTFWLCQIIRASILQTDICWISYNSKWRTDVAWAAGAFQGLRKLRTFIWHYAFGQNSQKDFTPSYRPILRAMAKGVVCYPDAVRVPSARQTKYNDKRANPAGRVPDDVWDIPRVCGTFKEKRRWHPNQHPEALIERIVKFSCKPGDLVVDMFAGTGTVNRVCKRLGVNCIGIEISEYYCEQIRKELFA